MPVLSAHDVARELRKRLLGLPQKKLHKLLYYCQGYHLAAFAEPLFAESIFAWDMGPVVGELWRAERDGERLLVEAGLDNAALNSIGYVVSRYGGLSGKELEDLTHAESPWRDADAVRKPGTAKRIPNDAIRAFFLARTRNDDDAPSVDSDALTEWLRSAPDVPTDVSPDSLGSIRSLLVGDSA